MEQASLLPSGIVLHSSRFGALCVEGEWRTRNLSPSTEMDRKLAIGRAWSMAASMCAAANHELKPPLTAFLCSRQFNFFIDLIDLIDQIR